MIQIVHDPFNPWQMLEEFQTRQMAMRGKFGATSLFVGTMRDFNEGDSVMAMTLEHYPGMTEKQLQMIVDQASEQWAVLNTLIVHRVGEIQPDQPIVLVAVWSEHRGDAFDASRFIMEALKNQAPFWKKERLRSGNERWVEKNTDGYHQ